MALRDEKKLVFKDLEAALIELNASDRGRYYICECPECRRKEAFIYKNNMSVISCNRESQCGERMVLRFENEKSVNSIRLAAEKKSYPPLTPVQKEQLQHLTNYLARVQYTAKNDELVYYRGMEKSVLRPFALDLEKKEKVRHMFEVGSELFQKDYQMNDFMLKRNLVFPIYSEEDGQVERILLRSSDRSLQPKEIQLIVNPSKETKDFFVDIHQENAHIVVAESILDACSFRQLDRDIGILALTGAAKTRQLCRYIAANKDTLKDKKFILAMDYDKAGAKAALEVIRTLKKESLRYEIFSFKEGYKQKGMTDPNEYLQKDTFGFIRGFHQVKKKFRNEKQPEKEQERC